ncbi:MAG TPA: class III signal peptide-containing protein [Methanobacterium sp.]|nr:class III signal peptide-containing protein [Methanobacterium sp.]
MDQRGQISVEYILLAAIVLLVVIIFAVAITNETELNSVATAVKLGAENGTTQLSILNATMQPVRVTSINMTGTGNVNIQVKFSSSVNTVQIPILQSINRSLTSSGYTTGYTGGTTLNLQTSRHNYTITLVS